MYFDAFQQHPLDAKVIMSPATITASTETANVTIGPARDSALKIMSNSCEITAKRPVDFATEDLPQIVILAAQDGREPATALARMKPSCGPIARCPVTHVERIHWTNCNIITCLIKRWRSPFER